ncbi:hypothetical protein LF1_56640 [Rubripirellula obstinata]|uniref:Uncharacterized protein n=2 Tax=Rubripirellula obstinata TaxID=406547 RepID=A0A5B1C920_9BACT|nr:hypothetical protein LF1_56640 [Rubripirellula obstinata]
MSKMRCSCGHAISDSNCPCPTEASVIGDVAYDMFDDLFTKRVDLFLDAVREGRRRQWIDAELTSQYPDQCTDGDVISTLLSSCLMDHCLSLAECPQCGRLWIQRGIGVNKYRAFSPDEPGFEGHLAAEPTNVSQDDG